MNANSIWAGEEYAYFSYRPNKTFVMNAKKGKAIKVYKRREYGNDRLTAYVEMEIESADGSTYTAEVRARDVIDFWDSYENERNAIQQEREEKARRQEEEYERQREERERRRREEEELRLAKERAEQQRVAGLVDKLVERTGMPRECVHAVGAGYISLDRQTVEVWLSV